MSVQTVTQDKPFLPSLILDTSVTLIKKVIDRVSERPQRRPFKKSKQARMWGTGKEDEKQVTGHPAAHW